MEWRKSVLTDDKFERVAKDEAYDGETEDSLAAYSVRFGDIELAFL